ncbi:MAG: alpha/beta hydrolase fold domain-containing protein [Chitinivibrionales bacterium]|nr:alpha/beta hydrolase fold domain-containing protein [Chitinivibrionales bacterium]
MHTLHVFTDIVYDPDHERCRYDVFRPHGDERVPLVLLIHGGGWTGGHRVRYHESCLRLASEGYAAVTIGYRLSPQVRWPEIAYGVLRAAAHIKAHADEWAIDADRAVTWGSSAGGHLALVLQAWASKWVTKGISGHVPEIVGTVAQCPVVKAPDPANPGLGAQTFGPEDRLEETSPYHIAGERFRSVLIVHGDKDATIPIEHSRELVARLSGENVDATLVELPGAPHGFGYDLANAHAPACMERALSYVKSRLGSRD